MSQPNDLHGSTMRLFSAVLWMAFALALNAETLVDLDLTKDTSGWIPAHDVSALKPTPEGLEIHISGTDPYIYGPVRDYPTNQPLWANFKLRSESAGMAQLFYFQKDPSEENSIRFNVEGGSWTEARVPMGALGPGTRVRFDPPGAGGTCTLARISFQPRIALNEPIWETVGVAELGANPLVLKSGAMSLIHSLDRFGAFEVRVGDSKMAVGNDHSQLGYVVGTTQRWLVLTNPAVAKSANGRLEVQLRVSDLDGAGWNIQQTFSADSTGGDGINVETRVTVDQDRTVAYLPMFTLLPGVGSFGTNKTQALLAGVEYLENEASSSERDVIGPGSRRRVPDSLKLTFPLMALAAQGNYIGLMWEQQTCFSALHDSPDRLFHSGGHVMGLLYPGSDLQTREDGSVLPYQGQTIQAGKPLVLHATIIGGSGKTIVPAVQQYVACRGIPAVPNTGHTTDQYYSLAAHGWLDSKGRAGSLHYPAVAGNFSPVPASDAALYMDWLSLKVQDTNLSLRLATAAREALSQVPSNLYNALQIGHVRYPVQALVYGAVHENVTQALNEGRALSKSFQQNGTMHYHAPDKGLNLGRTHWSDEANGLVAPVLLGVLERGVFSGDKELIADGLRLLKQQEKFRDTVPRGAQTWEVPLHTPDILASAYLVRAYTLGYELTGETDFLDQARYWAWTGVPFIYLTAPNSKPVGVYSTIPVFGATVFVAPLWIGLPVQWCGLVYGDAVRSLARHDPQGPWAQIADGIAAVGIQHTHPESNTNYVGLLPDSFDLRTQVRNEPPITPASVFSQAHQMNGAPAVYDFRTMLNRRLLVHAPGPISSIDEQQNTVTFKVNAWSAKPWYLLINGLETKPTVKVNGIHVTLESPHLYQSKEGRLVLQLTGQPTIEIRSGQE